MKLENTRICLKNCNNNVKEPHNIPIFVKNNIKRMFMEKDVYSPVDMLCRNYSKITESNRNKNETEIKLQSQSARSQRWFDLDFDCIEEHFSTQEPDFCRKYIKSTTKHKI